MQTRTAARLKRGAIDAEALYDALQLLSVDDAGAVARNRAARVLLVQLRALSACTSVVLTWSRAFGARGHFEEAVEDAIQHAALVASTGSSRFRGRHPNEAVCWCRRILSNFLASEARRSARTVELFGDDRAASTARLPPDLEAALWRDAGQESALALLSLESRVRQHLEQTRTRSASESLYRAVRRYLGYLAGQSEKARGAPEAPEASHPDAARRARDRRYQHHRRARRVLAELLEADARSSDSNAFDRARCPGRR